ncbi:MAG TPA: type III pantothenate kinase [Firmicutes bacterium]|nr:type III pantothenate kinase [Candidatus Fermentithermobacillaceae bacterium]
MLLAIDVGNTKIAIGVYSDGNMVRHWRISTGRNQTEDEYGMFLTSLLHGGGVTPQDIDGAVLACVVPPVTPVLEKTVSKYLGVEPLVVGPGVKTGINIKYENPKEVGPDRIAHAVAAVKKYGAPVVIIDFGTATTFDAVSAKGEYLGGIICPGILTSLEALFEKAAKLPRIELSKPRRAIGRTSAESMQSGMIYGFAGMVDSMVKRLAAEMRAKPYVVATGDLAETVSQESASIQAVDPFLALDGLRLIHEMNVPANPGDS